MSRSGYTFSILEIVIFLLIQMLENYVQESKKKFLSSLNQNPLSRFRYSIHFFAHLDTSSGYCPQIG